MILVLFAMVVARGDTLSFGSFITFNAAFGQFFAALLALTASFASILSIIPLFERLKPIVTTLPELEKRGITPDKISGSIEINHLAFRYQAESPWVFKDLSLNIKPGKFIAIVGPSGAGKSTLFRLLLGFETPEKGNILFDNFDVLMINIRALRRNLGVVLQSSNLMPGTILENIIGASDLTEEDAWSAVRLVALEEEITDMPMKMQTLVMESGHTLSVGQRQRLLIARALVHKPKILLLDEATSAVDNVTQKIIHNSLDKLNITKIIAAHRLSTIIKADYIYVLDNGEIVQSGKFDALIAQKGLFAKLAQRQMI